MSAGGDVETMETDDNPDNTTDTFLPADNTQGTRCHNITISAGGDVETMETDDNPDNTTDTFLPDDNAQENNRCHNMRNWNNLTALLFLLILVLACIGIGISVKTSPPDASPSGTSSTSDNDHGHDKIVSEKESGTKCIHYTNQSYLNTLPNNLTEYCVPEYISEKIINDDRMTPCGNTKMYIKKICLCDKVAQCPDGGDIARKNDCFVCRDEYHCPCQNNGKCRKCIPHQPGEIKCNCTDGTAGTYCTKITKRLCSRILHLDSVKHLEDCETSNNVSCLSKQYANDLVCELTDSYNGFANCSSQEDIIGAVGQIDIQNIKETKDYINWNAILFGFIVFFSVLLIMNWTYQLLKERFKIC